MMESAGAAAGGAAAGNATARDVEGDDELD